MTVSINRIRELLDNPKLTEDEIGTIRDDLQATVKIIFEKWRHEKGLKELLKKS